jgi:hypothetical protein
MIAAFALRPFCKHTETLIKADPETHRLYTECLRCFHQSPGIITHPIQVPVLRVPTSALNRILGEN